MKISKIKSWFLLLLIGLLVVWNFELTFLLDQVTNMVLLLHEGN